MVTSTRRTLQKPLPRRSLPPSARGAIVTLHCHHCTRAAGALILAAAGVLFGCAADRSPSPDTGRADSPPGGLQGRFEWRADEHGAGEPPWPVVHASWRDIVASVHWAASRSGFALYATRVSGPGSREFLLTDTRGREGVVRVSIDRFVEGSLAADPWVRIEAELGALGTRDDAEALVADLRLFRPAAAR